MYEQYYGMREKPFSLTPDPEFLFLSRKTQAALDQILYGIHRREGFTVIVGDVGTGKTTLCWALLGRVDRKLRTALVLNPLLSPEDILRAVLQDFGVRSRKHAPPREGGGEDAGGSDWMRDLTRKELIDELDYFLVDAVEQDTFCVLIIDEAQNLSDEALELLRMLSNLETSKKKLLQIIFVGQLEFQERLREPHLRALNQRISNRFALAPLTREETARYIDHRLNIARASSDLGFTRGALRCIFRYSGGYPRLVNLICDRALLAGYSERSLVIRRKMAKKAVHGVRGNEPMLQRSFFSVPLRKAVSYVTLVILALLVLFIIFNFRGVLPFSFGPLSEPFPTARSPEIADEETAASVTDGDLSAPEPAAPDVGEPSFLSGSEEGAPSDGASAAVAPPVLPAAEPRLDAAIPGPFVLQAHSLKTLAKAQEAASDLEERGYASFMRFHVNRNGSEWFAVYVGPFQSRDRATEVAAELNARERIAAIIRVPSGSDD